MSVDTYLLIPVASSGTKARLVESELEGGSVSHVGSDYLVLYEPTSFQELVGDPELWGPRFVGGLPESLREGLDPRGLLAFPEVGQSLTFDSYAEAAEEDGIWLPLRRPQRRLKRVLLVALSAAREDLLRREPELVRILVDARHDTAIPRSLELDGRWVELQKALFDFAEQSGVAADHAEAIAPSRGLLLYEDRAIDSARLLRKAEAQTIVQWTRSLPDDLLDVVARRSSPSARSMGFPESLGAAMADDDEPLPSADDPHRSLRKRTLPSAGLLQEPLALLRDFYTAFPSDEGLLVIRFRE